MGANLGNMDADFLVSDTAQHNSGDSSQRNTRIRVLAVIPGDSRGESFGFAKQEVACLMYLGIDVRPFFLASRTSPLLLLKECRRLRREIREFRPDLLHAHYGT